MKEYRRNIEFFFVIIDEPLDCNDSFNELEDLGEIATIELPDDSSFVISNDDIGKGDGKEEVKEELETNIEEEETKLE